jgi:hypothetical protein
MKITAATASSLGEKLAGLDLSDEEGVLLTTLVGADAESEVDGFADIARRANNGFYDEVEIHFRTDVVRPFPNRWKVEEGESYTEVEWTY